VFENGGANEDAFFSRCMRENPVDTVLPFREFEGSGFGLLKTSSTQL
jgi:hypothetical protein